MNDPDIRQRAFVFGVIEAVAYDPLVTDSEADVVDGDFYFGAYRFMQESGSPDGRGVVRFENADKVLERVAGIDNVLDDQNVAIFDIPAHVHYEAHRTGGNTAGGVAGNGDELDRARNRKLSRQVGQEDERAFEYTNKYDVALIAVVV